MMEKGKSNYTIKLTMKLSEEEFKNLSKTRTLTLTYPIEETSTRTENSVAEQSEEETTSSLKENENDDTERPHSLKYEALQHDSKKNIAKKQSTLKAEVVRKNTVSHSRLKKIEQPERRSSKRKAPLSSESSTKKAKQSSMIKDFEDTNEEENLSAKTVSTTVLSRSNLYKEQTECTTETPTRDIAPESTDHNRYLLEAILFKVFIKTVSATTSCNVPETVKMHERKLLSKFEEYEADIFQTRKPSIKVMGIKERTTEGELLNSIRNENRFIDKNPKLKVKSFKPTNRNPSVWEAILECDPITFQRIVKYESVRVNNNICRIKEYIYIKLCYNCGEYGYSSQRCGGYEHLKAQCNNKTKNCPNCSFANDKFKRNFDTNHSYLDWNCSVRLELSYYAKQLISYQDIRQ